MPAKTVIKINTSIYAQINRRDYKASFFQDSTVILTVRIKFQIFSKFDRPRLDQFNRPPHSPILLFANGHINNQHYSNSPIDSRTHCMCRKISEAKREEKENRARISAVQQD